MWRWLYSELRSAIIDGRLKSGARLPSTRNLAAQFGLARGTVVAAFQQPPGWLCGPSDIATVDQLPESCPGLPYRPALRAHGESCGPMINEGAPVCGATLDSDEVAESGSSPH